MYEHVITQVAIIGAGTMGAKIAHRCAVSNLVVRFYDKYPEALKSGVGRISGWLRERVQQGHLTAAQAEEAGRRIRPCTGLQEGVIRD